MEWRGRPSVSAPQHYPPIEFLRDVSIVHGKHVATNMEQVPTDDNLVPQPRKALELLGRRLIYNDELVNALDMSNFNNDHLVGTRKLYHRSGPSSAPYAFREDPSMRVDMIISIHNLRHLTQIESDMANEEVMLSRARESRAVKHLYRLAHTLLFLKQAQDNGMQSYRIAENFVRRNGYRTGVPFYQRPDFLLAKGKIVEPKEYALPSYNQFLDALGSAPSPVWGILPDPETLAGVDLEVAVQVLGDKATAKAGISVNESTAIILDAARRKTYPQAA